MSITGLSPSMVVFPKTFFYEFSSSIGIPITPVYTGLGSSQFARRYFGNLFRFLFLQVLRCFNSLRLLPCG